MKASLAGVGVGQSSGTLLFTLETDTQPVSITSPDLRAIIYEERESLVTSSIDYKCSGTHEQNQ